MKQILLLRHANSKHSSPDHERELNKKGIEEAEKMADFIKRNKIKIDHLLTSSAQRTVQTGEIVTKHYSQLQPEKLPSLYHATLQQYIHIIKSTPEHIDNVLIVGHNPAITEVLNYLCDSNIFIYPTCGLSVLKYPSSSWKDLHATSCELEMFVSPEKIK